MATLDTDHNIPNQRLNKVNLAEEDMAVTAAITGIMVTRITRDRTKVPVI